MFERSTYQNKSVGWVVLLALSCAGCTVAPEGLSEASLSAIASDRLQKVASDNEPIGARIDLYEAIARALRYNLDHRVELAELALRDRELELAHYSLLPGIVANTGYSARNSDNASSSVNVKTGVQSLQTSTSQDRELRASDIGFSWNILDFGLSYVRARQSADKVLIQNELRRKVTLRIVEEVRAAYWKTVTAQRMYNRIARIEAQARDVERAARRNAASQQTSVITALTYEREIVEVQRVLGELQRDLNTAHAQLAALMNVPPSSKFKVVTGAHHSPKLPSGQAPMDMIHTALMQRPELREVEYRKRINEQEAHAALLELLPGLQLIAGANVDSNSFLLHNDWVNWGAKASWNLIKVFSYPARRDVVAQQDELLDQRSLALTMAVMTQVYVSRVRFAHAEKELRTATRYSNVQARLLAQIRAEERAGRVSEQTLVREELNALVADVKRDLANAAVESAYANVLASMGVDPFTVQFDQNAPIPALATSLRASWEANRTALGGPVAMAQK